MASYLLKASDGDMERWKLQARRSGLSFAAFVRQRLDGVVVEAPGGGPWPVAVNGPSAFKPDPKPARGR